MWIRIRIGSGFDGVPGSGSGLAIQIQEGKNEKFINYVFCSAGCSLLRAEGFSRSLDVLYEGIGIRKLQILIKKDITKFSAVFLVIKTLDQDSRETLDPEPDSESGYTTLL